MGALDTLAEASCPSGMLDAFLRLAKDPRAEKELLREVAAHVTEVRASAGKGDRRIVEIAEAAVKANPGAITFDASGSASLVAGNHTWSAGKFEAVSIGELRARAKARRGAGGGRARLWLLDGAGPATDIGTLQAWASGGSLFQVASQFNCLESPGPFVTPVVRYLTDPTQGPRASISAFPGTLLRHYAAPGAGGTRFVQSTDGDQIELLGAVCDREVARAQNGYLMDDSIRDVASFFAAINDDFDAIQVGVHDEVDVALGYNWDGALPGGAGAGRRKIAQVFTSTVAGGAYGGEGLGPMFEPICRVLQRAAYMGTLLAAASLGKARVVLTLIGGGVFSNPVKVIWEAIQVALTEVEPLLARDLDVIVNGRDLLSRLPREEVLGAVRARGGAALVFDRLGAASIDRCDR